MKPENGSYRGRHEAQTRVKLKTELNTRRSNQSKKLETELDMSLKPEQKLETELDEIKLEMKLYHLGKKGPEQGH